MRLVVNGIPLLTPRSGIGNYVYHLFKALAQARSTWDTTFYYGIEWRSLLRDRPSDLIVSARGLFQRRRISYLLYRKAIDLFFIVGQLTKKFDLYHETSYMPMSFNGPTIVTVHDLSFHLYPEMHPKERIRYMDHYFYSRLDRATHYITISEAIKQEMVKHLNLPAEKISVTPLGVDDHFAPISTALLINTLPKYGLRPGFYILYVGTLEPRKNIANLLRAYANLPGRLRGQYPLVLAGGMGWLMEGLDAEIAKLSIQSTTIKTGYIPREDLPSLYSGAAVFVYPSLYEGFGLPPLEAMASGTPVITSNVSSLLEVVGDAGIQVPPEDVKCLSGEIESLLGDDHRRNLLIQKGLERAKQFTWEKCAVMTLEVYDRVIRGS